MPIHFLHKSMNFEELVALYNVADACVITSTRDGMNLVIIPNFLIMFVTYLYIFTIQVSYEYVACHKENHGVLILSEFAGAAQSLNGK
jgi:trehalose 6-phosphate synthase